MAHPILTRSLIWLVMPLVVSLSVGGWYLRQSLPYEEGAVFASHVRGPVRIVREATGVTHVIASSDADAFFAMGYVHAQDRLWQMESQRRFGQGRLAEVFGASLLTSDKFMRTLGLQRAAIQALTGLSEETRECLQAYAHGVNAWLEEGHVLPPEFQLLRLRPEHWRPEHSVLQAKLLALALGSDYQDELRLDLLKKAVGAPKTQELVTARVAAPTREAADRAVVRSDVVSRLLAAHVDIKRAFPIGEKHAGSNGWVVSGKLTRSSRPLLANDPHLDLSIPSVWYLVELHGDRLHVVGASIPGLPYVVIGHNERIAWGVTSLPADVQDVYVERMNLDDPDSYEVDGRWEPVTVTEETIQIAPEFPAVLRNRIAPIKWVARATRHGPLISDIVGSANGALALRWTALGAHDQSVQSLLELNYSRNWSSFNAALAKLTAPTLSLVYADSDGNIGQVAAGAIPVRPRGEALTPVPGWNDDHDWQGTIPADALPRSFNPESGYIVVANDDTFPAGYPYAVSNHWAPKYRAARISEMLEGGIAAGRKFSTEDFALMQGDVQNVQARELLPFLLSIEPRDERQREALRYLRAWDRKMSAQSVGATLYASWLRHFGIQVVSDELQASALYAPYDEAFRAAAAEMRPVFLNEVVNGELGRWCDDIRTPQLESCRDMAAMALESSLHELAAIGGGNMSRWRWGRLHTVLYRHSFSSMGALGKVFGRERRSAEGDLDTVNQAPAQFVNGSGYRHSFGAGYRQVISPGRWDESGFSIDVGQSGNVLSAHYQDRVEPHARLELLPMRFQDAALSGHALQIVPRPELR